MGDVTRRICKLLEDASAAEKYLKDNETQFARRAYVRSVFAYMEGTVWLLKQLIIQSVFQSKVVANPLHVLSLAELALLSDVSYDVKDSGEPFEKQKFLPLPKNLRLTVSVINRLNKSSIDLVIDPKPWARFKKSLQVRHRITHPKSAAEIDIKDEEILEAIEVCGWFNGVSRDCLEAFAKRFQKK